MLSFASLRLRLQVLSALALVACGRSALETDEANSIVAATGGVSTSVGGSSAGGVLNSTGGAAAGGNPSGGASTGGAWTGGNASGGNSNPPAPDFIDESECDLIVPDDYPTFDAAMIAAPQPSQLCLRPGIYKSATYGQLNIKDGVRVAGLGPEKPVLCEMVDASAAFVLGTEFREVVVAHNIHALTPVQMLTRNVDFQAISGCPEAATEAAIDISFIDPTHSLHLQVHDCRFEKKGVFVERHDAPLAHELNIEVLRSSCLGAECIQFFELVVGTLFPNSRLDVVVENNIVSRGALWPIHVAGSFQLASDAAASQVRFSSNTLLALEGEKNAGFAFTTGTNFPIVLDNNAIGNFTPPIFGNYTGTGNVTTTSGAEAWFQAPQLGDLRPTANSILRGAASPEVLPIDDYARLPRSGADVGALEYRP